MGTTDRSGFSPSHLLGQLRLFIAAMGAFVIGFGLYAWRPIWFSPPHHADTPILYALIALVWIPLWAYAIWRLPRHRLWVALLSLFGLPLTCMVSVFFAPQAYIELVSMRNEDYGSLRGGGLIEQDCLQQGRIFTCELATGSSDNSRASYYSYRFELIDPLPLMRLVSFSSRIGCNPGYITCPGRDAP